MAFPIAALLTAAASIGSSIINHKSAQSSQRGLMSLSDDYQRDLIADLPSLNKAGMQSAGLSTSMLNGAFQSASSNAASTTPAPAPAPVNFDSALFTSILQAKNLKKQNELLDKQIEGAEQDVQTKKLTNDDMYINLQDKKKTMKYRAYRSRIDLEQPSQSGDVVVSAPAEDDYMSDERYRLVHGLYEQSYHADERETTLRNNKAIFENDILTSQIMDKDVRNALINAPLETYNQVVQNVRKLRNDNDFFENVKKYREEVEKLGPRAAILGLFNTLTDIQGKKLANQLNGILMPYLIKDKQTDTENKTNDSKNSYNNILERFLNGHGSWKDAVRIGMPIVQKLVSSLF
ncbi:putative peptidase [Microviridae sp.]|nr:putative peptidase [Microviridae sp.]